MILGMTFVFCRFLFFSEKYGVFTWGHSAIKWHKCLHLEIISIFSSAMYYIFHITVVAQERVTNENADADIR